MQRSLNSLLLRGLLGLALSLVAVAAAATHAIGRVGEVHFDTSRGFWVDAPLTGASCPLAAPADSLIKS